MVTLTNHHLGGSKEVETVLTELEYWKTKASQLYVDSIEIDEVNRDYISKDKIRAKIEELMQKYKAYSNLKEDVEGDYEDKIVLKAQLYILQELLKN